MSWHAIRAIYLFELARTWRTIFQSIATPVISTSLYFVVFGAALGSRMQTIEGVSFGAFIVPGLILLTVLTESLGNASFGIYLPKFTGTIYELLSAPVSAVEAVIGYVGAAATKSVLIAFVILATARLFVPYTIDHPFLALLSLILIALTFSLFGFILGVLANGWEQLQVVPVMIITPLTFLGGTFYSIDMLPEPWRTIAFFNPVVYLISGFRWAFYGISDVNIWLSLGMTVVFMAACLLAIIWIFRTGYRLRS